MFWPAYAAMLARNWVNQVNGPVVPWTPLTTVSPNPLAFGKVAVGKTAQLRPSVEYVNGAGGLFMGTGATITGPDASDFALIQDGCNNRRLNRSQSCHLTVGFVPKRTGSQQATLTIPVQPPGVSATLALSGTGTRPAIVRTRTRAHKHQHKQKHKKKHKQKHKLPHG